MQDDKQLNRPSLSEFEQHIRDEYAAKFEALFDKYILDKRQLMKDLDYALVEAGDEYVRQYLTDV